METYNVCYKAAFKKNKRENPSKTTMKYITAKPGLQRNLSKKEKIGFEKLREQLSKVKAVEKETVETVEKETIKY